MSCTPGYSRREAALMQALRHLMCKNHPLDPAGCDGCREVAAFLALPGYPGGDYPQVH